MNHEIEKLEKELSDIFKKNKLPDVNKCTTSSYYIPTGDSIFLGESLLFVYVKFEDSNKARHWSLARVYNDIRGYSEDKHIELLQKSINIFKSIYTHED